MLRTHGYGSRIDMNKRIGSICLLPVLAGFIALLQGCVPPWAISEYYRTEPEPSHTDTLHGAFNATARTHPVEQSRLRTIVDSYIGTRYASGKMSRDGVDCSGFVCLVYKEVNGRMLPRSVSTLYNVGNEVALDSAQPGDLVFFTTTISGAINHVGIFMGNSQFVHASTSSGVRYNSLEEKYYKERFSGIRRYPS